MDKQAQIKQWLELEEARQRWLTQMVASDLEGPRRAEVIAFLKNVLEEDKRDQSFYKIQLMQFQPEQYYDHILLELGDILSAVSGISLKKDDSLRYIELSFYTPAALEEFKRHLPFGFSSPNDRYEFIERKRNKRTRNWEIVTQPILWRDA